MFSQHENDSLTAAMSIPLEPLIRDYDAHVNYDQSFFSFFSCCSWFC